MKNSLFKILFTLLFIIPFTSYSQEDVPVAPEPKPAFTDRLRFGGNVGATFGSFTYIDLSPQVGYMITEKNMGGVGATYIYTSFRDLGVKYSTNIYGGSLFDRHFVTDRIFLHGEYQPLNVDYYDEISRTFSRTWVSGVLVGGGFAQEIGEKSYMGLQILYNLNHTNYSPYRSPLVIRGGFTF